MLGTEDRFSLLCAAAFDGILIHQDGVIVEVSEKCCGIFGCEPESMIGRSILDFTAPHMHDTVRAAVASNQSEPFESVGRKANGELFPLEVCGASRPGTPTRIVVLRDLTGRKKAEADRLASEREFRLLAQAAFEGVIVAEDGVVGEANQAFADMYGYAVADIVGRPLADFLDAAALDLIRKPGPGSRYQTQARRRNGSPFFVEVSWADLGSGRQIFAAHDVTDRREAEERLVESERRYRELVEQSHDLICSHDLDGRILFANASASRILGISPEELQKLNVRDILVPGAQPLFDSFIDALRLRGMAEGMMKVMTCDGRIRIWEYRSTLLTAGIAVPVVRSLAQDVTDREEALRAVRRSEEHFRSMIENGSDVVGILDPIGMVRYHSPSLERALGFSQNDLTGTQLLSHVHPDDVPRVAEFIIGQSTGATDGGMFKLRLKQRPGTYRSFEVIAKNLMRQGSVESIIINARDVTERELLQRQLEQANRLTALGRLAATVAHEFNNVLMGMLPFVEILQRRQVTPETRTKCLGYIANSIQRGKRVALDILRFTQPASPSLTAMNLSQWWRGLEPELRAQIGNHIAFSARLADDVEVAADPAQLAQVFANLVNNARDAMPRAGQLTVSTRQPSPAESFPFGALPDPSAFIQISVADTGSGIPPEVIGHVFDPLFTTKESGGTGLGLAVAYQVITRHGGYLFVESEIGRGTTLHVFLPKVTGKAVQPRKATVPSRRLKTKRLLLVDDEEAIIDGIADLLGSEGVTVDAVRRGGEAMAAVTRFMPEIVLLDIGLPDLNGREVARQLRAVHPDLPIIFATGHGDRDLIALDEYSCFLQKPFELGVLLDAISSLEGERTPVS